MLPQPLMRLGLFCFSGRSDEARGAQCRSSRPDHAPRGLPARLPGRGRGARDRARRAALLGAGRRSSSEHWEPEPPLRFDDLYGNVCRRFELRPETPSFAYDATVAISLAARGDARRRGRPAPHRGAPVEPPALAPAEPPVRVRSARRRAPGSCSATRRAGAARVAAICDWIHENVEYGVAERPDDDRRRGAASAGAACAATSRIWA